MIDTAQVFESANGGRNAVRPAAPLIAVALLLLVAPGSLLVSSSEIEDRDRELWAQTVEPFLADDTWRDRDAYDAGHFLMVPLHAAFRLGEPTWQEQFARHMRRMVASGSLPKGRLDRLQYLYLSSRFCVLAARHGTAASLADGLPALLRQEVIAYWLERPAWQWGRKPFIGGIRERLIWKLDHLAQERSYFRAFTDEDLYLLAIAADLIQLDRLNAETHQGPVKPQEAIPPTPLGEILDFAYRVFHEEGRHFDDGGWVFQPGVWSDHPDYAYAGHARKAANIPARPRPGIAQDLGHSRRYPLWLLSLEEASAPDPERAAFYRRLRNGFGRQLLLHVLEPPGKDFPAWRTRNYLDGWNGLYRWQYRTQGPEQGYGPFEVSGNALLLGWWSFLDNGFQARLHGDLAQAFPLARQVFDVYYGPGTTRVRHPLVMGDAPYQNGFFELILRLGAKLCSTSNPPVAQPRLDPDNGRVPLLVSLSSSHSFDPDGGAVTEWEWSVDGEVVSREPTSVHLFRDARDYRVALRVRDEDGGWSLAETRTVHALASVGWPQLQPAKKTRFLTRTPSFDWKPVAGATAYEVRIITWAGQDVVVRRVTSAEGAADGALVSWTSPVPLSAGEAYRIFVRAEDKGGYGPWSPGLEFSVAFATPEVLSPIGVSNQARPLIRWTAVADAESYELWLVDVTGKAETILRQRLPAGAEVHPGEAVSFQVPDDLAPGSVYRVSVGVVANGRVRPWSIVPVRFRIVP